MGIPVAFLVSDPRLCATKAKVNNRVRYPETINEYGHHAIMIPIVVYVPLVIQKVAKYLTCTFSATVSNKLQQRQENTGQNRNSVGTH